ncbi:ABC transporter substrate-binding protein [Nitrincola sp.]|uniref:ABC transporter substrate-binding protein n=1 Tax=Nitrincola sp. TaxID=1926584 RepID=UPI003A91EC82
MLSDRHHIYQDLANAIQTETFTDYRTLVLEELDSDMVTIPDLILAIGTRACETALQLTWQHSDIVCTFLPSQTFIQLVEKYRTGPAVATAGVTAIFMDQPLQRQILLARLIAPSAQSIGTVFGSSSVYQQQAFMALSRAAGFEAQHAFLDEQQNPVQVLTPLIQRSDVFLSLPDSASFNRNVTRWSLYITLRNRVPLIGFSASYAEAGAVVSMYTTPQQLAKQTSQVLSQLTSTDIMPAPAYPVEFTLNINQSAARTLRLDLPAADVLTQHLTEVFP